MDPTELALLCAVALATSALSAVVGMAGGVTLLSVMLLFLDPLVAIPLHGVVQLVSNGSRAVIQRRSVVRWIVWRYALLLVPTGIVGLQVARALPPDLAKGLIGAFVLVATWAPQRLLIGAHPERAAPGRRFVALGGVVGLLNVTVGATGPLIAPFFLNLGLSRQEIVGSKAACQTLGHLVKIAIFGVAGFAFRDYWAALLLLAGLAVLGTWLGSLALERVNELWFTRLYKGVLTAVAARLVLGAAL